MAQQMHKVELVRYFNLRIWTFSLFCMLPAFLYVIPTIRPSSFKSPLIVLAPIVLYASPVVVFTLADCVQKGAYFLLLAVWPDWIFSLVMSKEISVEDYIISNPVIRTYAMMDGANVLICTEEGLQLWKGFIDVIMKAYRSKQSWAGTFGLCDLKMNGHQCRISSVPDHPATFENLLMDFSKLASLLIRYYRDSTSNNRTERYIKLLYNSMTWPPKFTGPILAAQEKYILFIQSHLSLRSPRQRRVFFSNLSKAYNAMGPYERRLFSRSLDRIRVANWRNSAMGNEFMARVVTFNVWGPGFAYERGPRELFRFIRNFIEHGGDNVNGVQRCTNLADLELLGENFVPTFTVRLMCELIRGSNLTGTAAVAWQRYTKEHPAE